MNSLRQSSSVLLGTVLAGALSTTIAHAAINSVLVSNVDARFGSQNDAYQDRFPLSLPASWAPVGPGPYPIVQTFLVTSAPPPSPLFAPSGVTPFGGAGSFSSFTDTATPANSAFSFIQGYVGSPGDFIDDAQIALTMSLTQAGASSYAYEQLNYSIDYDLVNTPNTAGFLSGVLPSVVTRNFSVFGSVGSTAGSYAQFGGEMNFWSVSGGTPTAMGTLTFSYLNTTAGSFSTVVNSSGLIGTGPVNNPDSIRITGSFYLAGDPSSITVQSVPEPSSLALLGLGALGLMRRNRRQS